jgi:ABC-2 type transport system ATP-binding protein
MDVITTRRLSKVYTSGFFKKSAVQALDDVSISVQEGEIFSLLGPNGAGKTTFVRILLGIVHPTAGEAAILGEPISEYRIKEKVGFLPENHRFPPHLTGEGVLHYFGALSGMKRSALTETVTRLLGMVGMEQWRRMKIRKYSKGMLQRIGLAQALLNDPALIFLDEPTDGVDPVGRREIRTTLKRLRDDGKTIFLNSHLLSEVELVSDRAAVLKQGRVIRIGTTDEFTATGDEYEIFTDGGITERVLQQIRSIDETARLEGNVLRISGTDRDRLNRIMDTIRSNGIFIKSMSQRKSTLEDSFIDLITNASDT